MKSIFGGRILGLVGLLLIGLNVFGQEEGEDTIPNIIKVWKINTETYQVDSLLPDTCIRGFEDYDWFGDEPITPTHLGNEGLPHRSNVIGRDPYLYPFSNFGSTFYSSNNVLYYNTRRPTTNLTYINGGPRDEKTQVIKAYHTQNINPYFNAGVRLNLLTAIGDYAQQETKNHSVGLWSSYERENYSLFANLNFNRYKIQESGGFVNDSVFESDDFDEAKYIETVLTSAKSVNRNISAGLSHGISLGGWVAQNDSVKTESFFQKVKVWHDMKYDRSTRAYFEDDEVDIATYQNVYDDSTVTSDSSYYHSLYNALSIRYVPGDNLFSGFSAGVFNQTDRYYCFPYTKYKISNGVTGSWTGFNSKRISWLLHGKMYLHGYLAGDYAVKAMFRLTLSSDSLAPLIRFGGETSRTTPSWLYSYYRSNHFKWEQTLNPVYYQHISGEIAWPKYRVKLYAKTGLFTDYVYFDEEALPEQMTSSSAFFLVRGEKDFRFGIFQFNNLVQYQKTGDETVFAVPEFAYKGSFLLGGFLFKRALYAQLGIDLRYQTEYYAHTYMPATGVFYQQKEIKIGNYPYADVFLNLKIREVRLFFKYTHLNQGLLDNTYYTAPHYAEKPRHLYFGLSWQFDN